MRLTSKRVHEILSDCLPEKAFYLSNGAYLRNIHELLDALKHMDDATFNSHVSKQKNDFFFWIRDVINDPDLADKINSAKKRPEFITLIEKRLEQFDDVEHEVSYHEPLVSDGSGHKADHSPSIPEKDTIRKESDIQKSSEETDLNKSYADEITKAIDTVKSWSYDEKGQGSFRNLSYDDSNNDVPLPEKGLLKDRIGFFLGLLLGLFAGAVIGWILSTQLLY